MSNTQLPTKEEFRVEMQKAIIEGKGFSTSASQAQLCVGVANDYIKQIIPFILEQVIKKGKVDENTFLPCDELYPKIDKQSILSLEEEIIKQLNL